MSRVARYLHEVLTALDLNLMQRFARREQSRVVEGLSFARTLGPRGATVADTLDRSIGNTSRALRGLEVTWQSGDGWTLRVSAGSLVHTVSGTSNELRPGTWSGRVENDDPPVGVGVLPADTIIVAPVPPAGPVSQNEVWMITASVSEQTIETNSQIPIFNQGTGVFDLTPGAKVRQFKVTLGIERGAGNAAPNFSILPAGTTVLALVFVPATATSHSTSVIFDCRKLRDQSPGPNRVGGQWRVPTAGTASASGDPVFQGEVWARLRGEMLSARVRDSLNLGDLVPTGLTWPAASTSNPQLAWLYLCTPGGYVPRPVRRGATALGNDALFDDAIQMDGVLVLSPVPPRLGLATSSKPGRSGLRWDLRPSAAVTLPGITNGNIGYLYQGLQATTDEALCVGFMRYVGVSGGRPTILGQQICDANGWCSGEFLQSLLVPEANLLSAPLSATVDNGSSPRTWVVSPSLSTVTIGGETFSLPIEGLRVQAEVTTTGGGNKPLRLAQSGAGRAVAPGLGGKGMLEGEIAPIARGQTALQPFRVLLETPDLFDSGGPRLTGIRLPYDQDLVT